MVQAHATKHLGDTTAGSRFACGEPRTLRNYLLGQPQDVHQPRNLIGLGQLSHGSTKITHLARIYHNPRNDDL